MNDMDCTRDASFQRSALPPVSSNTRDIYLELVRIEERGVRLRAERSLILAIRRVAGRIYTRLVNGRTQAPAAPGVRT